MRDASIALLLVFTLVATLDGFYFHIYRYRLYDRPASRYEHLLHTWNAVLFPATLAPLYLAVTSGVWLWLAVGVSLATFAIESLDVFCEGKSRESLGGLTPTEYWLHFLMSGLRWSYATLAFASVPAAAWFAPSSWQWAWPSFSHLISFVPYGVTLIGFPVAGLHVLLALQGAPRRWAEDALWIRRGLPA